MVLYIWGCKRIDWQLRQKIATGGMLSIPPKYQVTNTNANIKMAIAAAPGILAEAPVAA